jgi:hypothetical protein
MAAVAGISLIAMGTAVANNGPSYTAVVNSDGSLARGLNATVASRANTGVYLVDFNHDITACGYTATIGVSGNAGVSNPGIVTVVGHYADPKGLYIQTFDRKGNPADLGFHIIVAC